MRWLVLLVLAAPASAQLLVGVGPDLPSGLEGVAVGATSAWTTTGWSITDGEGTITIPPWTIAAGESLWLVNDHDAWRAHQGPEPAVSWTATGAFRLANDGDGLTLLDPSGRLVDTFSYGDHSEAGFSVSYTSDNLLYLRDEGWSDTDSATDWTTPRAHRIGESRLDQPAFTPSLVVAYAAPDSSFEVLSSLISSATRRLHLHVYELGSQDLAQRLAAARQANPGLDLQVLVDGSPVGFTTSDRHRTAQALQQIEEAGGQAFLAGSERYRFHHLKVLVADDAVAVQSENWVASGVPRDPSVGNRGWGLVLHDKSAADWFSSWMAADRAAWDTTPFDLASFAPLYEPSAMAAARTGDYGPVVRSKELAGARVIPLVSPDHTQDPRRDAVARHIDQATHRVLVQQLDLAVGAANRLGWSSPDPLLDALARAASRGVPVRALAAAPFSAQDDGNGPEIAWLVERGVDARVMERPGILTMHNKGIVVDDRVILGSMNGNHHSRSSNREVSLVVESADAAAYFAALFESDWSGTTAPPDLGIIERDVRGIPGAPLPSLLAVAAVVAARVRR